MLAKTLCLALLVSGVLADEAIVKLQGEGIEGIVRFKKVGDTVEGRGKISGLKEGQHGFHVHQLGDLSNGCASTGGHFNPYNKTHGAPADEDRHVGDLGNVVADASGDAPVYFVDKLIDLQGPNCIIGRAVVVHADVDDLGKGNHKDSLTTGNAGGRVACGIIGIL